MFSAKEAEGENRKPQFRQSWEEKGDGKDDGKDWWATGAAKSSGSGANGFSFFPLSHFCYVAKMS